MSNFRRMDDTHKLVKALVNEPWWPSIVQLVRGDKDFNVQIRENYINVYCQMGNFLKIKMDKAAVSCEVHWKYLVASTGPEYVKVTTVNDELCAAEGMCPRITNVLDPKNIVKIKENISKYVGEEKCVQSKLVHKNYSTILDAEIAFNDKMIEKADGKTRIDLVHLDKKTKLITFVELKLVCDERLYSKEITNQVSKYHNFASTHEKEIIDAYNNSIKAKIALGLIQEGDYLFAAKIKGVEVKPLLIVGGYKQLIINALDKVILGNVPKTKMVGVYFFGKDTDLNLLTESKDNKHIF